MEIQEIKKYTHQILKGASILLILAGMWIIVDHYFELSPENISTSGLTKMNSIVKEKKVIPPSEDRTSGSKETTYEVVLEYQFPGTQKFYKNRAVDKSYFDRLFEGDTIILFADKNNPYHVVLPGSRTSTHNFFNRRFFFGILLILAGIALWFFSGRKIRVIVQ